MQVKTAIGAGVLTLAIAAAAAMAIAASSDHAPDDGPKIAATSNGVKWPPFPTSYYWSKPIPATAATDPRSDAWSAYVREKLKNNPDDSPLLAVHAYTTPIWVGRANDPLETIGRCYRYSCPSVAGARVRVPPGARADQGSDGHMVIVDPRTQTSYELFKARRSRGSWAGAGAGSANLRRGDGSTGERASGPTAARLSLLAGLIRPSEIRRGRIRHTLAVTIPGIGRGAPRCPARANVPTTSDPNAPPEGTRFQIDPSVNLRAYKLPRLQRIIAVALQRYGMIVNDNGGKIAFRAENYIGKTVDGWAKLGYAKNDDSVVLKGIPLNRLRVVAQRTC